MLGLKVVLLAVAAVLAVRFGPFSSGDSGAALATGLVLVSAMAIQNAVQRIDLSSAPPTTVMTSTTTQIMIDIVDMAQSMPNEKRRIARARLARMPASIVFSFRRCWASAV
jgi:uncharacterized membrane protein YoaK (UPF0700 family)